MAPSTPSPRKLVRAAMAASALTTLLAGPGCIDLVGADINKYVEREEKRFSTTGTPDVALSTFDGSIEIRAWDKPEVEVIVEKRASSKEAAQEIEIHTEQHGNQVTVDVKAPRMTGFAIHFSRSAKLIVSMPASSNVTAKSGDGAIDLTRITGQLPPVNAAVACPKIEPPGNSSEVNRAITALRHYIR